MEAKYEGLLKFRAIYDDGSDIEFTAVEGPEKEYAIWRGELAGRKFVSVVKLGPAYEPDFEF